MATGKEAIVFIPGLFTNEKDYFLNAYLIRGLTKSAVAAEVRETGEVLIEGCKGKQLSVKFYSGETKTIDLYEAYWFDLIQRLSTETLREKVMRGIALLFYWAFSKVWMSFRECPTMVFSSVISLFLILLWYYGTITMALTAIGNDPAFFGSALPEGWAVFLGKWGETLGGWSIWLAISAVLGFIRIDQLIDATDFTRQYLQDTIDETTGETIRLKLRKRIMETIACVLKNSDYDRITIVAHSFGTLISTEVLSDMAYPFPQPIHYITLGGPLKLLSLKSHWVHTIIEGCLRNPQVASWIDYYADRDWLCTQTPIHGMVPDKFECCKTMREISLWEAWTGKAHNAYFYEREIIHTLLRSPD
jgi:hypothetical protein